MMSGATVGSKLAADRALQQQIQTVWKTLQDTRSNLSVCDTLVRQIVKPSPVVSGTVLKWTRETSMQTDALPMASVGTQCVRATVESACCQAAPELCAQGVQAEEFSAAVRSDHCQAVADIATSAVQTVEAGVRQELRAVSRPLAGVSHREYQRLKRKTEVLKRRLRAERARSARALSRDNAYRLSALRLATLALSIQETYQEMLLDLGSLLQQLAALACDAVVAVSLPPPDGVGGWYRQVRELAAAALRCLIEKRAETGRVRTKVSEVPSREQLPEESIQHERNLVTLLTLEGVHSQSQITDYGHSLRFRNAGRRESRHTSVESRQRSSQSVGTGDDGSVEVCGQISSRASIRPQSLICSSQKTTSRENRTESESSFPYRPQSRNVQVARHTTQIRKCSQSHPMCDSDLGPCLKSKSHGDESRCHSSSTSMSGEESAVDIACCSHTCHHHTYLKTFVESQKKSQVQKESSFSVKNIILNDSSHLENETDVADVAAISPDTREAVCQSCGQPTLSTHAYSSCKKSKRDSRSHTSLPVGAETAQKPANDGAQYKSMEKCVTSERCRNSTSSEKPPDPSQREHTTQQADRRQLPQCPSGSEGPTVKKGAAKSFCSTLSLGPRELPEHLQEQVEVLEKRPTSSDYTETISSSFTVSRTSYNSASSSSVPKTKLRSRRTIRPITSSTTDTRQSSHSPKGEEASLGRGEERSESANDETTTLTPKSGSVSTQQSLHLRFVEILDELKEKLLQSDE